jgi:hypothetical protein
LALPIPKRYLASSFIRAIKKAKASRQTTFNALALTAGFSPGSLHRLSQLVNLGVRVGRPEEERVKTLAFLIGYEGKLFVRRKRQPAVEEESRW